MSEHHTRVTHSRATSKGWDPTKTTKENEKERATEGGKKGERKRETKGTKVLLLLPFLSFCLFPAIPSRASPKHPASADAFFSSTYKSYQRSRWCPSRMYTHGFYVDRAATGSHKLTCKSRVPHTRLFLPRQTRSGERRRRWNWMAERAPSGFTSQRTRRTTQERERERERSWSIIFLLIFFSFISVRPVLVSDLNSQWWYNWSPRGFFRFIFYKSNSL